MKFRIALFIIILTTLVAGFTRDWDLSETELVREPNAIHLPKNYAKRDKWPLIVLLHAFKVSGNFQKNYFGLTKRMEREGFILFIPGTVRDPKGNRFWNAMDYCCNHFQLPVDDVGFLKTSITEVIKTYKIDPERVYLLGHSNGAMMAHRMACEHADMIAGIASLAGSGMQNPADCKPSSPVSILEIHAENDHTVLYDGMTEESLADRLERKPLYPYSSIAENVRYPSSRATIEDWVNKDGCAMALSKTEKHVNYALNAIGAETTKTRWKTGCRNGTEVSFWSLSHGRHVPLFNGKFKDDIVDFLLRQKKQLARQ